MSSYEYIDPSATNDTLPIMPSIGSGGSGKSTILDLKEFMKILPQSNACSREYCEKTKQLTLVFYNKTYTGCKVIIYLTVSIITIIDFEHLNILKNTNYTFDSSGFRKYVTPFLTQAELEKQKRFDEFQVEEKRLMAEQRELEKQEKKSRKEALKKAHLTVPKTCGGVDECELCKTNKAHTILAWGWKSNFEFIGT